MYDDSSCCPTQIVAACGKHGYTIKSKVGSGNFGTVYLALSEQYKQEFVVKVLDNSRGNASLSEIEFLSMLNHCNIVKPFAHFVENGKVFLVIEYCCNGSLAKRIQATGRLNYSMSLSYTQQLLSALEHCHKTGIAHRDIKPDNILIDTYGRPKLADFGLSSISDEHSQCAGSLNFMAPELHGKHSNVDYYKADIWSLGMTFYYAAVGRLPWMANEYRDIVSAVRMGMIMYPHYLDKEYVDLLKRMLVLDPNGRATCTELLEMKIMKEQKNPLFSEFMKSSSQYGLLKKPVLTTGLRLSESREVDGSRQNLASTGKSIALGLFGSGLGKSRSRLSMPLLRVSESPPPCIQQDIV